MQCTLGRACVCGAHAYQIWVSLRVVGVWWCSKQAVLETFQVRLHGSSRDDMIHLFRAVDFVMADVAACREIGVCGQVHFQSE